MKKVVSILCVLTLIFTFAACSSKGDDNNSPADEVTEKRDDPESIVRTYCEALKKYDDVAMNDCLIEKQDPEDAADDTFSAEELLDFFKEQAGKMTYTIENVDTKEDKSTVTVKFVYSDCSKLGEAVMQELIAGSMQFILDDSITEEEMAEKTMKLFTESLNKNKDSIEYGTSEATVKFECEKTEEGWRIKEAPEEIVNVMACDFMKPFEDIMGSLG